ncbi:MAG: bacillithiol biosynthesis cysteine-adding enzyme BshC [bacterium]
MKRIAYYLVEWHFLTDKEQWLRTYLKNFSLLSEFYRWNPLNEEDWKQLAENRMKKTYPWLPDLVGGIRKFYGDAPLHPEVEKSLSLLQSGAMCVITGQQPGLFGGPAYTWIKAVATKRVAHYLQDLLQHPVVPIFWMVSEDSDLDEMNWTYLYPRGDFSGQVEWKIPEEDKGKIAASVHLDASIYRVVNHFCTCLPETPRKNDVVNILSRAYCPGNTLSHSFFQLMEKFLSPLGIIFFDPTIAEFQKLKIPIFQQNIHKQEEIHKILTETGKAIRKKGFKPQLFKQRNRLHFFHLTPDGKREKMEKLNGEIVTENRSGSVAEWESYLGQHPEKFAGGVVLRPMLQQFVFPCLCYVGGTSELLYWAQIQPLYPLFHLDSCAFYPRPSIFLGFTRMFRILSELGLPLSFLTPAHKELPPEVRKNALSPEGVHIEEVLEHLLVNEFPRINQKFSSSPVAEEVKAFRKELFELKNRWKKILINTEKENIHRAEEKWKKVYRWFFPNYQPQERVLNGLYFYLFSGEEFFRLIAEVTYPPQPASHFFFYEVS